MALQLWQNVLLARGYQVMESVTGGTEGPPVEQEEAEMALIHRTSE